MIPTRGGQMDHSKDPSSSGRRTSLLGWKQGSPPGLAESRNSRAQTPLLHHAQQVIFH